MPNRPDTLIPFVKEEYLEQARSRVTLAFEDKPVFDKFLQLICNESSNIQDLLKQLKQLRTLEEATGQQLDIVGAIVGQSRVIIGVDLLDYFGMEGHIKAMSFGDVNNTSVGGPFFDLGYEGEDSIVLPDDLYRIMIKARILKNTTRATPEDLMTFMNFVFNAKNSLAVEGGGHVLAYIGRRLSQQEVIILEYIDRSGQYDTTLFPKPLGVNIEFGAFDGDKVFGFQGISFAKGIGDINDPSVGGYFAEIGFTQI